MRHRKRIKHVDESGHAHELTFSCYRRWPLLNDERPKLLLSQALDRATARHEFELVAFVYMPEHVHLLVFPCTPDARIANLLYAIKRPHAYRTKQWMLETRNGWLERLTIRERPGKQTFRFWQEGAGYDRNITSHDVLLKSAEYIHNNPIRRGLCLRLDEWRWSSWHHYENPKDIPSGLPRITSREVWK